MCLIACNTSIDLIKEKPETMFVFNAYRYVILKPAEG